MTNTQSKKKREGKERKKEKQIDAKPDRTIIHELPREEEDTKTNQIIQHKYYYNYPSQPHASTEGYEAVDMCETRINNFFFFFFIICTKTKISLEIYNNNKKNHYKITTNPLKSRLNFFNVKDNGIIKLFIYYKSPELKVLILTFKITIIKKTNIIISE
jgi:hypothetical protein